LYCASLSPLCSSLNSGSRRSSYSARAALNLRSGCLSTSATAEAVDLVVISNASSASLIFDALSAVTLASIRALSIPRVGAAAAFFLGPPDCLTVLGAAASSAFSRASRSAFFIAASCFFSSAAAFLALAPFAPSCHSTSSLAASSAAALTFLASAAAAFWKIC